MSPRPTTGAPLRRRSRAGTVAAGLIALVTAAALAAPAAPATAAPADPPGSFSTVDISGAPASPYANYRIPALASLGGGVVLAAWDGRPGSAADSPNPNSIVLRRSTDGGQTWGALTTVRAGVTSSPKSGYSDPSLVYDAVAGKVFLFSVYSKDQGSAAARSATTTRTARSSARRCPSHRMRA